MGSGREIGSRPTARRFSGRRQNPFKTRLSGSYSHINIQPASSDAELSNETEQQAEFVKKESLQDRISDELEYANKLAPRSGSKSPPGRPTTFAEAAMSTRVGGGIGRTRKGNENSPTSKSYESLGKLKYSKKKKKAPKWSPFDLSAPDDVSEVGNTDTSRDASPDSTSRLFHNTQPFESFTTFESDTPIAKGKGVEASDTYIDTDPTPTQNRFDQAASTEFKTPPPNEFTTSLKALDTELTDTVQVKTRFADAMAHLSQYVSPPLAGSAGDAFDAVHWDPNLPAGSSPDKSPEQITIKPTPVAYTTVGSLVNPNIVPQFSAPNRIQREGAGRRPLMTMPNRHYDSLYNPRSPPPLLKMQNSMHYTQQLQPSAFEGTPSTTPQDSSLQGSFRLTENDKEAMVATNRDNLQTSSSIPSKSGSAQVPNLNNPTATFVSSKLRDSLDEDELARSYGALGLKHGLEKMQTLQRLARFENPMREAALNRLSVFSVANANNLPRPKSGDSLETMLRNSQAQTSAEAHKKLAGELNRQYEYPQAGGSTSQSNPLFAAYGASTQNSSGTLPRPPPGYPVPLTAGPPGQRQATAYANQNTSALKSGSATAFARFNASSAGYDSEWSRSSNLNDGVLSAATNEMSGYSERSEMNANERQYYQQVALEHIRATQMMASTREGTPVDNDLSAVLREGQIQYSMADLFPYGADNGLDDAYNPPSPNTQLKMLRATELYHLQREKEIREDLTDDWFYSGQRAYHMTPEEHINELGNREPPQTNPFGPIGPPTKSRPPVIKEPVSIEAMEKLSTSECAAPLLDAAFGTFLAYTEVSSVSRKKLSGWVAADPKYIDDTVEGRKSSFGEDWGRVVPRTSRATKPTRRQ